MRVLGIDPGYAIVGFGVVEYHAGRFQTLDYGALTTVAHTPMNDRLLEIYQGMQTLLSTYRPDAIAVEELFFNTNRTTAVYVCQARGVIMLAAKQANVPVFEYTPSQVKQAVVGYGKAEKKQVQLLTQSLLRLKTLPRPDDAADALAIAICHAHSAGSAHLFEKGV